MQLTVLGIRHHGPGSARSVLRALQHVQPDIMLIEGPPDADPLIPFAASAEMEPPVALLIYRPDLPSTSAYYPFAQFSPEWQAIQYALAAQVPVRFMDLPQWHRLAMRQETAEPAPEELQEQEEQPTTQPASELDANQMFARELRQDPLKAVARLSGYEDCERWWELMVEQRTAASELAAEQPLAIFTAITELMGAIREQIDEAAKGAESPPSDPMEAMREAWMRQTIRAAEKEGFQSCAVVCGAYHAPALVQLGKYKVKEDAALLKGLPKVKTAAAWTPWTYSRLSTESGYGAGIESPGYYSELWASPSNLTVNWMSRCAQLLRSHDLEAATASVIEAVRLADALSAMRSRQAPGLEDLREAALAVLCSGATAPMDLIERELVIGTRLGKTPADAPIAPLQQDIEKEQKRLRLPAEATSRVLNLDLRKQNDLSKSILLNRLLFLGIPWGAQQTQYSRSISTFHEDWHIEWKPEFAVRIIEAGIWGNTVQEAASARAAALANDRSSTVKDLASLLDRVQSAELPDVVPGILARLQSTASIGADTAQLMASIPPLVNALRYGSVRGKADAMVQDVLEGMVVRVAIGLSGACIGLNSDASRALHMQIIETDKALRLLNATELIEMWQHALDRLADTTGVNGLITGRACRLLLDHGYWDAERTALHMNHALAAVVPPAEAGDWVEGFLAGSGTLLIHNDTLWQLLDAWVTGLTPDAFEAVLPAIRRTVGPFSLSERQKLRDRAKAGRDAVKPRNEGRLVNLERASLVVPILNSILGAHLREPVQ